MALERFFKFRELGKQDDPKPFLEHLEELRWTLIKMAITLVAGMVLSFFFMDDIVRFMQRPLHQVDPGLIARLQVRSVTEPLTISIRLAFYSGIVLTFPFLLFFLAQFVVPALTTQEKKYVLPGIAGGFALFLIGASFSYCYVLPETLAFFAKFAQSKGWTTFWTVQEYFSFATQVTVALGMAFELPVVVIVLVHLGFLTFAFMRRTRTFAVVIILCLAAVIAPTPDPFTFLSLGLPMCLLYEGCIWIAWLMERRRSRSEAEVLPPA